MTTNPETSSFAMASFDIREKQACSNIPDIRKNTH
jgi:hypothetical protein